MNSLTIEGIRLSKDMDGNTIWAFIVDNNQEQFERSLRSLVDWLSIFNVKKIIFQLGGNFVIPDWFLDKCKQMNIDIKYACSKKSDETELVELSEKDLENCLVEKIETISVSLPDPLVETYNGNKYPLGQLIGSSVGFDIFQDTSSWQIPTHKNLMLDVIGGMTPDIVLRSKLSGENRIYIEVKKTSSLNYGIADSQIIRYFLYLLASSRKSTGKPDLQRAIILAAPQSWFNNNNNQKAWNYFLSTYGDLAKSFDIIIGRIIL